MRCFFSGALLLAVLSLAGCSRPHARGARDLALYFTCDLDGRLEPCGCFSGQHGGLSRFKTWLARQPAEHPLLVDVGDALEGPADFQVMKYRHVLQALGGLHYEALNVGAREARLPLPILRDLRAKSPVPLLSANLLEAATGRPVCAPYRLVEREGYRIAVVGVVAPGRDDDPAGEGLTIEPIETALGKLLPTLRGQADLFILLAFADEETLGALAKRFYEFDLILGGKVRQPSQRLEHENRTYIAYTTNESKAVGVLHAQMAGPSLLVPKQFDIAFLDDQIPQDPGLLQESENYRVEVRQARLAVDDPAHLGADAVPGVHPAATWVGSESCATCHPGAAHTWSESGHAHAFAALVERHSEADPSCIGCHTVGFGTPGGYRRQDAGAKLVNVGCESCHGPGSEHVAQRQSGDKVLFKYRPLSAADCASCHHGEFSRPFVWETFWPAIQHGKELTAARP